MDTTEESSCCTDCGTVLSTAHDQPQKMPCPTCGSMRRSYNVTISERVVVRDGYESKAKRSGEKKPFIEDRSRPSFSTSRQKLVHHERVIDRENDRYFERVTDYETGEVIHTQEEPLTSHVNHGTAKGNAAPDKPRE